MSRLVRFRASLSDIVQISHVPSRICDDSCRHTSLVTIRFAGKILLEIGQAIRTFRLFTNFRLRTRFRNLVRWISWPSSTTDPLFVDPKRLLLDMARERSLPDLLDLVVDRLAESPRVALARIWLVRKSPSTAPAV